MTPPDSSWRALLRAWAAIARRPSRAVLAFWGERANRTWVIASLALAAALTLFVNILDRLQQPVASPAHSQATGLAVAFSWVGTPPLAVVVVASVVDPLAIAYVFALTMPAALGTISTRFGQVLRLLALSEVVVHGAGLVPQLFVMGLTPVLGSRTSNTCVAGPLVLGALIYSTALLVNALSAGSGKGRWAVFGMWVATGFVSVLVFVYVPSGIIHALGSHLAAR